MMSRCLGMLLAAGAVLGIDNVAYIRVENPAVYVQLAQIAVFDTTNTNVALMKPCENSQAWKIGTSECTKTVDGTYSMRNHPDIYHSRSLKEGWMEIDLQGRFTIQRLEVWNRKDCCRSRMGSHIVKFLNDKREDIKSVKLEALDHNVVEFETCAAVTFGGNPAGAGAPVMSSTLRLGWMSLTDIPSILMETTAFAPVTGMSSGSIELKCCEDAPCAFVVSLYKCQGCAAWDGGLRAHLAADRDWAPNSCAPAFNYGAAAHPMVNFRRVLQPKEAVSIPVTSMLEYITIFKAQGADGALCFKSRNQPKGPVLSLGGNVCTRKCAEPPQ